MKVFYTEKQVVDQGKQGRDVHFIKSPSAMKPKQLAEALKTFPNIEFVEPNPVTFQDFELCHDLEYVCDIVNLKTENGFGNKSQEVNDSLYYTNGAMYDAAVAATVVSPTAALVSGFHHAGYKGWRNFGYFCTFNGLMLTAMKFNQAGKSVAIIDADQHHGNGTDDILDEIGNPDDIYHFSFGFYFKNKNHAKKYLEILQPNGDMFNFLEGFKPDVILYQAGADVHIDDPAGGVLTTEEIYERDKRMFSIAKELKVPITWNLAGGYQIAKDGSIDKVLEIHLNTFRACQEVYGMHSL